MAYLEKEKAQVFLRTVCLAKYPASFANGLLAAADQLNKLPTADVVPSSEVAKEFTCFVGDPHKVDHCPYLDEIETAKTDVERLERILNSYALQYGTVKDQQEVIDKAKAEVAREIFEDIDKILSTLTFTNFLEKLREIAELKKKYTEEHKNDT